MEAQKPFLLVSFPPFHSLWFFFSSSSSSSFIILQREASMVERNEILLHYIGRSKSHWLQTLLSIGVYLCKKLSLVLALQLRCVIPFKDLAKFSFFATSFLLFYCWFRFLVRKITSFRQYNFVTLNVVFFFLLLLLFMIILCCFSLGRDLSNKSVKFPCGRVENGSLVSLLSKVSIFYGI